MSDFTLYIEKNGHNFYKDPILYQEVSLNIKKFSNEELLYYKYFYEKTNVIPKSILILNNILFYFIDNEYYAEVNEFLNRFRNEIRHRKILFIYLEEILANLIYRFFPDIFIYDLIMIDDEFIPAIIIIILSFKQRGVAIGRKGNYIKTVNKIFEDYVKFKENPVKIRCEVIYSF